MPSVYVTVGVPPTVTKVQPFGHVHLDSSLFVFNFSLNMARQPGYSIMRNVHPKWCYFYKCILLIKYHHSW